MAASYRRGVEWIALNDDAGSDDARIVEQVRGYISTLLLADLFGKEPREVATDVVRLRMREKGVKRPKACRECGEFEGSDTCATCEANTIGIVGEDDN